MPAPPPPSADPLVALADRCVQCGLCLPACPTYALGRIEAESPRGRIAMARAWALDTLAPTPAGDAHLDACLGCRSCEAVCPAGVQYGDLLATARARQRERRPRGLRQRAIEALTARPRLLAWLLRGYRHAYGWLPSHQRPLPAPQRRAGRSGTAGTPATASTALFVGCVAHEYEADLRDDALRVFATLGIGVGVPTAQTCCGSIHRHAGAVTQADTLAARNRRAFARSNTVLTLASGCHEALARALPASAHATDAIEFLAQALASRPDFAWPPCTERVALHLPCTQRNVVRSVSALRRLLACVPGLEVVELNAGYGCCGAAGTQMLDDPVRAAAFRAPLLRQIETIGPARVLSANIGCRLHLAQGMSVPVEHPLRFLARLLAPSPPPRSPGA